jgi:hypothetical protein
MHLTGCFERGNYFSGCIKCGEFLDKFSESRLVKEAYIHTSRPYIGLLFVFRYTELVSVSQLWLVSVRGRIV